MSMASTTLKRKHRPFMLVKFRARILSRESYLHFNYAHQGRSVCGTVCKRVSAADLTLGRLNLVSTQTT